MEQQPLEKNDGGGPPGSRGRRTRTTTRMTTTRTTTRRRPHLVFVHLDLGIGGAEQLVINLASASLGAEVGGGGEEEGEGPGRLLDADVTIYTTHRSPTHCFDEVRPPHGILAGSVRIRGTRLPRTVLGGRGAALCSAVRMAYLTWRAAAECGGTADVYVVDVLPTGLPALVRWWGARSVLFYCHFPDKLLTAGTVNGEEEEAEAEAETTPLSRRAAGAVLGLPRRAYRAALDGLEERTMGYADLICVNSAFTREEVGRAFPTLLRGQDAAAPGRRTTADPGYVRVLYPPIDLDKFVPPDFAARAGAVRSGQVGPIVSLNRFERKKNVAVLLRAYSVLASEDGGGGKGKGKGLRLPDLVVAGGYDPRSTENVSHLAELRVLATELGISDRTTFLPSVSDAGRADLLRSALCVAYTPHREHFGIVPLEAMYAGSPVVAVDSGGPRETVVHGVTGLLVDGTVGGFASALRILVTDPGRAVTMGRAGHARVRDGFGLESFRASWAEVVEEVTRRGRERRLMRGMRGTERGGDALPTWAGLALQIPGLAGELLAALAAAWALTLSLRAVGLLPAGASVWGEVRRWAAGRGGGDEL